MDRPVGLSLELMILSIQSYEFLSMETWRVRRMMLANAMLKCAAVDKPRTTSEKRIDLIRKATSGQIEVAFFYTGVVQNATFGLA